MVEIISIPFGLYFLWCWFRGINVFCELSEKHFGPNWIALPYFTGGLLLPGFILFRMTDEFVFLAIGLGITFLLGVVPGTKDVMNMVRGN